MNAEIEFGPAIHVNGVKPEWLKNDEWRDIVVILNWDEIQETDDSTIEGLDNWGWSCIKSIRLPSSHAVYSVIAHNAEHGTKFTYWPGGVDSNAPSDWDGKTVLYRDGSKEWCANNWEKYQGFDDPQCSDIIGYTKSIEGKASSDPDDAPELTDEWFERAELIPSLAQQVTEALAERDMLRHQVRELRAQLAKVKEILG